VRGSVSLVLGSKISKLNVVTTFQMTIVVCIVSLLVLNYFSSVLLPTYLCPFVCVFIICVYYHIWAPKRSITYSIVSAERVRGICSIIIRLEIVAIDI
jgi:hypothetical protein